MDNSTKLLHCRGPQFYGSGSPPELAFTHAPDTPNSHISLCEVILQAKWGWSALQTLKALRGSV